MSKSNPPKSHSRPTSPRLETMYEVDENNKPLLEPTESELLKLKSKFSDLHGEHQKLLAVTSELTNTLQMNIIGQSQNIYYALEQCKNIYPTLFANNNLSPSRMLENFKSAVENGVRTRHYSPEKRSDNNDGRVRRHSTERSPERPPHHSDGHKNQTYSDSRGHNVESHQASPRNMNRVDSPRHTSRSESPSRHSAEGDRTDKYSEERSQYIEGHDARNRSNGGRNSDRRNIEDLKIHYTPQGSLKTSPRLEEQKNAIVEHIMTHTSRTNSPRSPRTQCTNNCSHSPPDKSPLAKKEKNLEASHFIYDLSNQNDNRHYRKQYVTQFCEIEPLNLGEPSNPDTLPEIKHPLTPDTVRHVLDLVFNRIFEIESAKPNSYTRVIHSAPLNREEVKKVVDDVFDELIIREPLEGANLGCGEGEVTKSEPPTFREYEKLFDLNFEKVKNDLITSETDRRIRLLQALRWRITKNDTPDRDRVMETYTLNDILDLYSGICLPERLLNDAADIRIQESVCRLINTIASLRQGRDYLTSEDRLLKRILLKKIKDLRNVTSAVIRNMLLASVQKLSIRKQCRNQMVYEGLLENLVDYLDEFYEKLSRYSLEYSSALVMNLCLTEEAKDRSKRISAKFVGLIRKLLDSEVTCCLPYINGIMFSLLEKEEIVSEAIAQNLDKIIIRIIKTTSNESMRKQLEFILQARLFGKGDPVSTDNEEDGREEVDLLEIELDEDDFITLLPSGEKLLEEYRIDNYWGPLPKPLPGSARTFNEETKQFYHKPSSERGIFENAPSRSYQQRPQGLISNFISRKNVANTNGTTKPQPQGVTGRWSQSVGPTPLCYMENCQKMLQGGQGPCSCSKCVPGQSRYSCGCYDVIRKEVSEIDSKEFETKSSDLLRSEGNDEKSSKQLLNKSLLNMHSVLLEKGGEEKCENEFEACKICGEKSCDCAFDSRPKLNRTPTKQKKNKKY